MKLRALIILGFFVSQPAWAIFDLQVYASKGTAKIEDDDADTD